MSYYLDNLGSITAVTRESYGCDKENKPNDHCYWDRLIPSVTSEFGWIEADDHFRERIYRARITQ